MSDERLMPMMGLTAGVHELARVGMSSRVHLADAPSVMEASIQRGRVHLNVQVLKSLRAARLQSQDDMATACIEGRFRVSIASIKRAETGKPVMFRVARELARYFDVPVKLIILPTMADYRPAAQQII